MSNYNVERFILKNLQYNFEIFSGKSISISLDDSINILDIKDKHLLLSVTRELSVKPNVDSYVKINCEVSVSFENEINRDIVMEALRNNSINLISVFSKISLLMTQITNLSPFGIIVTPPTYDPRNTTFN
ncbi:MAG: hypothetical protein IKJ68_06965 [Clostridia bacterium]|nr:hypothetical protein [Clostridia bacterium]